MPRIALFFTLGNSLEVWHRYGMLERELALYRRLADHGVRTTLVTYGRREQKYLRDEKGMVVCFNRFGMPDRLYELAVPFLHWRKLRKCRLFKTNQANGGQVALRAARLVSSPLVARCGYMWSAFAAEQYGRESREAEQARQIESRVFAGAERIVVTTAEMRDEIAARIPGTEERIRVIPNYVDTHRFFPDYGRQRDRHVLFIGRLAAQKNVRALLKALEPLDYTLTVVGDGEERCALMKEFASDDRIEWLGSVSHEALPVLMNSACIFILPSLYEGQPKVLLEAMACGLAVLGADRPGIRELIDHGRNGHLCEPTVEAIREAVDGLLGRPDLREQLGREARRTIERDFSLDSVVKQELEVIHSLTGSGPVPER